MGDMHYLQAFNLGLIFELALKRFNSLFAQLNMTVRASVNCLKHVNVGVTNMRSVSFLLHQASQRDVQWARRHLSAPHSAFCCLLTVPLSSLPPTAAV